MFTFFLTVLLIFTCFFFKTNTFHFIFQTFYFSQNSHSLNTLNSLLRSLYANRVFVLCGTFTAVKEILPAEASEPQTATSTFT